MNNIKTTTNTKAECNEHAAMTREPEASNEGRKKHHHHHHHHHHSSSKAKASKHDAESHEAVLAPDEKASSHEKKSHHHGHHNSHPHTEILPDGTRVTKYKKKKQLPDGSTITKAVAKSALPVQSSGAEGVSYKDVVLEKIKRKTRKTRPDGVSHTTTTVEEVITPITSSTDLGDNAEQVEQTSVLPDGSKLTTIKETKRLAGNRLSSSITRVHVVEAIVPGTVVEPHVQTDLSTLTTGSQEKIPPEKKGGVRSHVDSSLNTTRSNGNFHEGPYNFEDSANLEQSLMSMKDFEEARWDHGEFYSCNHHHGSSHNASNFTMSMTDFDQSLETIESHEEPMPLDSVQEIDLKRAGRKTSHADRGVGAHFITASESDAKEAKLKSKAQEFQQGPAPEAFDDYDEEPIPLESSFQNIQDKEDLFSSDLEGHQLRRGLEAMESYGEEPIPIECAEGTDSTNVTKSSHLWGIIRAHLPDFNKTTNNNTPQEEKRDYIQRLFKVVPDTKRKRSWSEDAARGSGSSLPSKAAPKDQRDSLASMSMGDKSKKSQDHSSIDIIEDTPLPRPGYTDDGLVVAKEVDPSDEGEIYDAIEYDPDSKPPMYKNRRCRLYTMVLLLVVTIVTALAVVYSTKKSKEVIVPAEVTYVTEVPTAPPTTDREALGINDLIEEKVLQRNAKFRMMKKDDPRWMALDWILHKDEMQLGLSDLNLFQRYVLALIAFQFDSLAWTSCGGNYSDPEVGKVCFDEAENSTDTAEYFRWLTSTNECDWYGVKCLGGKVRELQITENNLIGEIPPELSTLRNLDVLSLSSNCLIGNLPPEMGTMVNLQQLNLEDNGLSGTIPDELFGMSSLTHLNLAWQSGSWRNCTSSSGELVDLSLSSSGESNWGLEGAMLEKITPLRHLKEIIISGNYFSGEITPEIKNLKQLEILSAGNNAFSGSLPSEISDLRNLREIGFEFNWLTGSIPQDIGQASALEIISLFGIENMTGTLPDSLYYLANLKHLLLYENQFEGSIKSEIGNLSELTQFSIYNNMFTGTLPSELGRCEKLEWVQINGNDIVGTVPKEVCDLREKKLYNDNPIVEVLKADCSPDSGSKLKEAYIQCDPGCCHTCCDHTTYLCINLEIR